MRKMEEKLIKYFSGESSDEESKEILKWREASQENASAFFESKSVWLDSVEIDAQAPQDVLEDILGTHQLEALPRKGKRLWMAYAAMLTMVIGAAFFFYFYSNFEDPTLPPFATIDYLADGSTIKLYRGSTCSVMNLDDNTRVVHVTGRVYFDVVRDESKPFIIYADDAMVKVLGTSFVVDTESDQGTQVLVESGTVSMMRNPETSTGGGPEVLLYKGEKGILNGNVKGVLKQNIRNQNYLSWSNGVISFREEKLKDVSNLLEEVYGMTFTFEGEGLPNCQLTAKFHQKTKKEIIEIIASTFDIEYRITNNRVVFSGKGC